jgi:hypothetical protein
MSIQSPIAQSPIAIVEIFNRHSYYPTDVEGFHVVHFEEQYQPETKVGAIPANFFFSL